jgi:hypothetical protein
MAARRAIRNGQSPFEALRSNARDEGVSMDEPKACLALEEEFGFDVRPHTDVAG